MVLYDYFRSSASYRVRIAVHYKSLECRFEQISLLKSEQMGKPFTSKNPQGLVPLLEDDGVFINQSLAIIEYLDEKFPEKTLIYGDLQQRARIRAFASEIACDIHPLNNLRVLKYLENDLSQDKKDITSWYHEWLERGFSSLEKQTDAAPFCIGEKLSLADCFLIPQIYNAYRYNFSMENFPKLVSIYNNCLELECFQKATPEARLEEIENDTGTERGN